MLGNVHRETGTSMNDLGQLLRERGDLAQAEALFRENVAITRKVLPGDHPNVATSLTNLAQVLNLRGDYDTAPKRSIAKRSTSTRRCPTSSSHHLVASTWNNLSYALRGQGRLDEAEAAARKALALMRAARGERSHADRRRHGERGPLRARARPLRRRPRPCSRPR